MRTLVFDSSLLWNCSTYLALVCKLAIEPQGARLIFEIKQSCHSANEIEFKVG
jgi:hypothetical protein